MFELVYSLTMYGWQADGWNPTEMLSCIPKCSEYVSSEGEDLRFFWDFRFDHIKVTQD